MNFFVRIFLFFPKTLLLAAVFAVVVCSFLSAKIPMDFSTESLFVSKDPHRVVFQKFKDDFGNDDNFIFVAFQHPQIFSGEILKRIKKLSDRLRDLSYVDESVSIVDVIAAEDLLDRFQKRISNWQKQMAIMGISVKGGEAFLDLASKMGVKPLIQELQKARNQTDIFSQPDRLDLLRKKILQNPLYLQNILSADGTTTGIFLMINSQVQSDEKRSPIIQKIQQILAEENKDNVFHFHLAGLPVVRMEYSTLISMDHLTFMPIIIPLAFLILFWIFRNPYQTLIPPVAVGAAVICTVGLMSAMGESINIVSNVIYVLLFVIGVASSIHVVNYYNSQYFASGDKKKAVHATMVDMGYACFFTSFTTAIGFLSLIITDIRLIGQFGLYSAIGVMITFIFSAFFVPIILYFLPPPQKKEIHHRSLDFILDKLTILNTRHSHSVLFITGVLIALFGFYTFYLVIDSHMLEEIAETNPVVVANRFVEKELTGILPLEILLVEKEKGLFRKKEELERIDRLQQYVASQKWIVSKVVSVLDVMKVANRAIHDFRPEYEKIPDKKLIEKVYELEEYVSQEERGVFRFTSHNQKIFRISIRLVDAGSIAHFNLVKQIESYVQKEGLDKRYEVIFTGETHMITIILKRLVSTMLSSIFMAAGIIFFVMFLMLRSFRISLISVFPTIMPIIFTLGVMGMTGIVLRTSTVVIFSISLGIAVDDTIHYLVRYREFLKEGLTAHEAVEKTLRTTGKAMCWTSMIIIAGLTVLMFSNFRATVDFGFLGSATLFSALIGDLLLLPSSLMVWGKSEK